MFLFSKSEYICSITKQIRETVIPKCGTNNTFFKSMEKKQKYNQEVLEYLAKKYGVSLRYIRRSLSPLDKAPFGDTIKKDYQTKLTEVEKILSV